MSNQNKRILDYLKQHGSITCHEALVNLSVARLPSRIHELKQEGHHIITIRETGTNRFGEKYHYARYKVVGE